MDDDGGDTSRRHLRLSPLHSRQCLPVAIFDDAPSNVE